MSKNTIDEKLLEAAKEKGLSEEDLRLMMTGENLFPDEFMEVIEQSSEAFYKATDEQDDHNCES